MNLKFVLSAVAVGTFAGMASAVVDANAIYSNVTSVTSGGPLGYAGFEPTATPGSSSGGYSALMADDITTSGGYLSLIRLSTVYFGGSNRTGRVTLSFWNADGAPFGSPPASGAIAGPGTYITGSVGGGPIGPVSVTSGLINFAAGDITNVVLDLSATNQRFHLPSGPVWVGVSFDNIGGTMTNSNLNDLGMALRDPPNVGSSNAEHMFKTSGAGPLVGINNPAGINPDFGGSGPAKNFAMELVIPAPGAAALLGLGGLLAGRRRR